MYPGALLLVQAVNEIGEKTGIITLLYKYNA